MSDGILLGIFVLCAGILFGIGAIYDQLDKMTALLVQRTTKSAPAYRSSLPSGESDPSVTMDSAGADALQTESSGERGK